MGARGVLVAVSALVHLGAFLLLGYVFLGGSFPRESVRLDYATRKFIYVYDILGTDHTEKIRNADVWYWSRQYEAETFIHDMLVEEQLQVTMDPEEAQLFYVPYFPTRHLYSLIKHWDTDLEPSLRAVSATWQQHIARIRNVYPYFNRSNGQDHFSVLTMDHGRCSALLYADPAVYAEMFFMQLQGDLQVRSSHTHTSIGLWALTYNWNVTPAFPVAGTPDIACYVPGRDIVLPPAAAHDEITPPLGGERPITALMRFRATHHNDVRIPTWGHKVRGELLELYENANIPGWEFGYVPDSSDWKLSKFCVAPPGLSQWTSRPVKSMLAGCIPVILSTEHHNPWKDVLDYDKFSINLEIRDLHRVRERIEAVMATPRRLEEMQRELARVQNYFSWEVGLPNGARVQVMRELRARARQLNLLKDNH